MKENGNGKRGAERKYTRGVLELYDDEGLMMMGVGRLLDLSVTGALVESSVKLAQGQVMRFRLRMDSQSPLDLMAKVARAHAKSSKVVYGLQFGHLSSAEVAGIQALNSLG